MGVVSIPAPAAGRLRCDIELSQEELSSTVELLRKAVSLLPGASAPAGPPPVVQLRYGKAPTYRPPSSGGSPSAPSSPMVAPATPAPASARPFGRPATTPATPSSSSSQATPSSQAQAAPAGWQAAARVPAPASAPATGARAPTSSASATEWKRCWRADAAEHNRQPITALYYRSTYESLSSDESSGGAPLFRPVAPAPHSRLLRHLSSTHRVPGGWLVSASNRILNLWECSRSAGRGEPALMIMHQQDIDYRPTSLDYDPQSQLLIAAAMDQRPNAQHGRCAALYSMDSSADGGLPLRFKAAVPMPDQTKKGGKTPQQRQPLPLLALSLSPLGAHLGRHLVLAHANEMAVADIAVVSSSAKTPMKAEWISSHPVTCLANYPQHTALLAGTSAGEIHIYNMKAKPETPVAKMVKQGAKFTSLTMVKDDLVAAGATNGDIYLWDARKNDILLGTFPLGSTVAGLSSFRSPNNCTSAACTVTGVQVGTVVGTDIPIWQRVGATVPPGGTLPQGQPPGVVAWNERTQDLLYGAADGTVQVFREGTGPDAV